jgi:ribosome-associated translation inhibitor RaiA
MMKKILILTTTLLFSTIIGISQTYDKEYTVEYINAKTSEVCKIFQEKKNIRIEFYSNGQPVRIDYIFPGTIDIEKGIYYSEDEQAIVFSCYEKAGKQIEREILKHGSKLLYDRSNLKVDCSEGECEALVTASKHLIQLYVEKGYERTKPFEEN